MILSPTEDLVISALGWADKNQLWTLETKTGDIRRTKLSDAKYLGLHSGCDGYFSVSHHHDGNLFEITAHSWLNPEQVLARVVFGQTGSRLDGDTNVWKSVPTAYVAFFARPSGSTFYLFLIEPFKLEAEIVNLDWYDESYDQGYQGVIGVIKVPGQEQLIISVQRDSNPVLFDLSSRKVISKISLAGRGGNPTLRFRRLANELWADDYDTVLRIDPQTWRTDGSIRLQSAAVGCQQFIGSFGFNSDESLCVVARPFSGDIIALDTAKFKITHSCKLGREPLQVALLSDGTVYSRDWKTGDLLKGNLKKQWF